jgi:hypothetical protein
MKRKYYLQFCLFIVFGSAYLKAQLKVKEADRDYLTSADSIISKY